MNIHVYATCNLVKYRIPKDQIPPSWNLDSEPNSVIGNTTFMTWELRDLEWSIKVVPCCSPAVALRATWKELFYRRFWLDQGKPITRWVSHGVGSQLSTVHSWTPVPQELTEAPTWWLYLSNMFRSIWDTLHYKSQNQCWTSMDGDPNDIELTAGRRRIPNSREVSQ